MPNTGHELRRLLGPLRRAVTRASAPPRSADRLSEAQVEVLRTLLHSGPTSTADLAARLRLARPTVSNLVTTLAQADLVRRELSATDARRVMLTISPEAERLLSAGEARRAAALQRAVDRLPAPDRATLEAALPVLAELLRLLTEDAADRTTDAGHTGPATPPTPGAVR